VVVADGEVDDSTVVEAFEVVDMPAVVVDVDVENVSGAGATD
jgi:hypothetical protein